VIVDDDQIETGIAVRYRLGTLNQDISIDDPATTTDSIQEHTQSSEPIGVETGHGLDAENNPACCRRMTPQGSIDCATCLSEAWWSFYSLLDSDSQEVADWVNDIVRQAGEFGVKKTELAVSAGARSSRVATIVNQMVECDIPQMYWTGYNSLVLVSAQFISRWSVVVSNDPVINVFPRRWLDIRGVRVADFWQAGLRAVMGLVVFRPGITQTEIRWRLRAVYDRQEVNDILRFLQEEGYLRIRFGYSTIWTLCGIHMPFDEEEERKVYWFIGDKHWYQL